MKAYTDRKKTEDHPAEGLGSWTSPVMTVFGQQVEVSTNETISGKTTLHGLTVCDFSNVAILSAARPVQKPDSPSI